MRTEEYIDSQTDAESDAEYNALFDKVGEALTGSNIILALAVVGELQADMLGNVATSGNPHAEDAIFGYIEATTKSMEDLKALLTKQTTTTLQ